MGIFRRRADAPQIQAGHGLSPWRVRLPGEAFTAHDRWQCLLDADGKNLEADGFPLADAYEHGFEYATCGTGPREDGWTAATPNEASAWPADQAAAYQEGLDHGEAVTGFTSVICGRAGRPRSGGSR